MSWDSACRNKSEAFRSLIYILSQRLKVDSLETFKRLCLDHLGQGTLEKIHNYLELFSVLEERDVISESDVGFLNFCFSNHPQLDLRQLVRDFAEKWIDSPLSEQPKCSRLLAGKDHLYQNPHLLSDTTTNYESFFVDFPDDVDDNKARPFQTDGFVQRISYAERRRLYPLPTEKKDMINFMADNLTSTWRDTLRQLGVQDEIIDAANYNWPNDVKRQIRESLEYWMRHIYRINRRKGDRLCDVHCSTAVRYGGELTKENLIRASRTTGREDLAQQLNEKFR